MKINKLIPLSLSLFLIVGLAGCGGKTYTSPPVSRVPSSSEKEIELEASYRYAIDFFKSVCGLKLPHIEKLEAETIGAYEPGVDYCDFTIVSGENLNYQTYEIFENFFTSKFGETDPGYPFGDEASGRISQWTELNREYRTIYDRNGQIQISVYPMSHMSESYLFAREQFLDIANILLPIINYREISDESRFDKENGEAIIYIPGGDPDFDEVYKTFERSAALDPHVIEDYIEKEEHEYIRYHYIIEDDGVKYLTKVWAEKETTTLVIGYTCYEIFTINFNVDFPNTIKVESKDGKF